MTINLSGKNSLSKDRSDQIAHALVENVLRKEFGLVGNGEYKTRLGNMATKLGDDIKPDELHQFILGKLPKLMGSMFGVRECGIILEK